MSGEPSHTGAPTGLASGLFRVCAEEDSNLHPVIPDQALNPIHRLPIASIPR